KNISPPPQPFTQNQSTQTDPLTYEYEPGTVNCPGPKIIHGPSAVEFPSACSQEDQSALESTLDQLIKEFTALKSKITTKLQQKDQALQETTTKLQTSTRQLETTLKENTENEKFLTQLIKEFQELSQQLE
ncbi:4503_t:CDS:2, partial [Entrophospora sp. SA101]